MTDASSTSQPAKRRDRALFAKTYGSVTFSLVVPTTICMLIVVWVTSLSRRMWPELQGSSRIIWLPSAPPSAPTAVQFGYALMGGGIVVVVFTLMTFLLVLCFKFGCEKLIWGWLVISSGITFFIMGGVLAMLIIAGYAIRIDWPSYILLMWNFGVVGVLSVYFRAHPRMTQGYLIAISVLMGWFLTRLPEWTAWTVLIAVAVYDLFAVLTPCGPLRLLLEHAEKTDRPLPGLIYDTAYDERLVPGQERGTGEGGTVAGGAAAAGAVSDLTAPSLSGAVNDGAKMDNTCAVAVPEARSAARIVGLEGNAGMRWDGASFTGPTEDTVGGAGEGDGGAAAAAAQEPATDDPAAQSRAARRKQRMERLKQADVASDVDRSMQKFSLGLGDFIFYSVLVGQASLFSYVTWTSCLITIIAGLWSVRGREGVLHSWWVVRSIGFVCVRRKFVYLELNDVVFSSAAA